MIIILNTVLNKDEWMNEYILGKFRSKYCHLEPIPWVEPISVPDPDLKSDLDNSESKHLYMGRGRFPSALSVLYLTFFGLGPYPISFWLESEVRGRLQEGAESLKLFWNSTRNLAANSRSLVRRRRRKIVTRLGIRSTRTSRGNQEKDEGAKGTAARPSFSSDSGHSPWADFWISRATHPFSRLKRYYKSDFDVQNILLLVFPVLLKTLQVPSRFCSLYSNGEYYKLAWARTGWNTGSRNLVLAVLLGTVLCGYRIEP